MFKQIKKDITTAPRKSVIFNQVNCQNAYGSGLAKCIGEKYPKAKQCYHDYCQDKKSKQLLGDWTIFKNKEGPDIVHLFGQLNFGYEKKVYTDYVALKRALSDSVTYLVDKGYTDFYFPYKLGSGYAGGDWHIIRSYLQTLYKDFEGINFTICSIAPLDVSCGFTEKGDPALDMSWETKLKPNINVIISKNLSDELIEKLIHYQDCVIFHHTVTGYGSSFIEPNVPAIKESFGQFMKLIKKGFPIEQYVLRLDPVIPAPKGIRIANCVLEMFADHVKYCRYSFLDVYPHIIERFKEADAVLPYEQFTAPVKMQLAFLKMLDNYDSYIFMSCAETTKHQVGCLSERDYKILGLDITTDDSGYQRKKCKCCSQKRELLTNKQPCKHGCLYCYWKNA